MRALLAPPRAYEAPAVACPSWGRRLSAPPTSAAVAALVGQARLMPRSCNPWQLVGRHVFSGRHQARIHKSTTAPSRPATPSHPMKPRGFLGPRGLVAQIGGPGLKSIRARRMGARGDLAVCGCSSPRSANPADDMEPRAETQLVQHVGEVCLCGALGTE